MAAMGDSLIKTPVKQQQALSPPSPNSKSQAEKQLHNLLQQTSSVHHNGGHHHHPPNSPKSVQYHLLHQLQQLSSENMPPHHVKGSPNGKSVSNRTKLGIFSPNETSHSTTSGSIKSEVQPYKVEPGSYKIEHNSFKIESSGYKAEPSSLKVESNIGPFRIDAGSYKSDSKQAMSPHNSTSNNKDDNKRINNNSVSYTAGGRLKFFKEGRCLLELTHKHSGEGSETWVPITKKIWLPPGPVKAESSPSVHSATSEGGSDSIPSPFPSSGLCSIGGLNHRTKFRPKLFNPLNQPQHVVDDLVFAMKPPPCIVSLRKKIRHFSRKCRQPFSNIVVGAFLMRIEAEAVKIRPPRRQIDIDHIRKASRLENCVTKMSSRAKLKKPGPIISIQTWKSSNSSSSGPSLSVVASTKSSSQGRSSSAFPMKQQQPQASTMRVKSELCPVTETCTAATLPPSSPSTHSKSAKNKPENRNLCSTTSSVKTLPITPTIARIKHEPTNSIQISQNCTSLISPDMHRVKVEIGRQYSPNHHMSPPPNMSTSPHHNQVSDFPSPRKRFHEFDNTSPATKRQRVSTDSRGSAGSGDGGMAGNSNGGTASPHPPHLFMHPGGVASPPRPIGNGHQPQRMSSFSIDSIISGNKEDRVDHSNTPGPVISSPKPIKPVALTPRRSPVTTQQGSNPLVVPITPYTSRGLDPRTPLDPRLAHLAGVAADPRLGLSPAATSLNYMMNPFYSSYLAASHLAAAAAAGLWRPPPSPSPAASSPVRTHSVSSATTMPSIQSPSPTPPPSASSSVHPSYSSWGQQYRGEPRVEAPSNRNNESSDQAMDTSTDLPLNLSLRR